jgi:hypothetical protein
MVLVITECFSRKEIFKRLRVHNEALESSYENYM